MSDDEPREQLTDRDELLFRHVHPSWVRDGIPTSQAFKPTPKDEGRLSVQRGSLTTAEAAFLKHTQGLGLQADSTWAVTVGEVLDEPVPRPVFADPLLEPVHDPARAFVSYEGLARKEIETKAKLLLAAARARGRQHP